MKKYARIFSLLALVLAITFVFSGCGVIDFAKSILIKEEGTTTPSTTISSDVVYTDDATNSAVILPPSDTASDTQAVADTTAGTTAGTTTDTTAGTTTDTTTGTSTATTTKVPETTKAPVTTDAPTTQAPATTLPPVTEEAVEKAPIHQLQDLLFATEDPNEVTKILNSFGFEYDEKQGIYYSSLEPWQKNFGFNVIYDMSAPLAGMYYTTERVYFKYDNKDWMIQMWKGQYGITAGAEVGVYNKTDKIMQYDCVSEDEYLEMSFDFYNQDEYVFSRGPEKHWWLTGFKIFNAGVPILIDLDITIKFPTNSMASAFEEGLKKAAKDNILDPMTYTRSAKIVHIKW